MPRPAPIVSARPQARSPQSVWETPQTAQGWHQSSPALFTHRLAGSAPLSSIQGMLIGNDGKRTLGFRAWEEADGMGWLLIVEQKP